MNGIATQWEREPRDPGTSRQSHLWLFRVFCEEVFTAEAQSSQRSENFLFKNSFTLRPPRFRGAISESCFTGKPEDPHLLL
jgi:hypothetical protein